MADSFVFYRSFYEAARCLPDAERLALYDAICGYAIDGQDVQPAGIVAAVFTVARPVIDANTERRQNGKKGGKKPTVPNNDTTAEPMVTKSADNSEPMVTKKTQNAEPMVSKNAQTLKPNENENENENENVNENVNEKHTNARARASVSDRELEKEFNELWATFPKKAGNKSTALTSYKRARKNGTTRDAVADGIERYKAWIAAEQPETRYIMQGTTFFVGRRWLDEWKVSKPRDSNKFSSGMMVHEYTDDEWKEMERLV